MLNEDHTNKYNIFLLNNSLSLYLQFSFLIPTIPREDSIQL